MAFIVPDGQHHLTSEEILDWLKVKSPALSYRRALFSPVLYRVPTTAK
ncbi:hypothetical protein J4733_12225 [Klebsiella pneumoniae]|uniref:Uncharacterized protein n=1 Tax=Klebsiella pneumoniae TaxID=573 RepID=A0A939NLI7_KLEPN|nr:hypothetical protein [Klebsiella pneumoniae]